MIRNLFIVSFKPKTMEKYFHLSIFIILSSLPMLIICRTTGGNGGEEDCVFPFVYQGQEYYACTMANHDRPWCSTTDNYDANKRWGNCEAPNIATFGGTAGGEKCYFPFRFLGGDKYECITDYHNQPWCGTSRNYDEDKKWGNCGATALKTVEGNSYGAPCCFPFMYEGVEFTGCTPFDSRFRRPWCSTTPSYDAKKQWGYCEIRSSRGNSDSANCRFPFLYNNKEYARCIMSPELGRFEPWCGTTYNYDVEKKWGYCIMQTTHRCEPSAARTTLPGLSTTLPPVAAPSTAIPQNVCVYSRRLENTNARGGTPSSGAQTVEECIRQCDQSLQCVGLDYDTNPNTQPRCYHHFDIMNLADLNEGRAPGIFHYRKLSCANQGSTCQFNQRDNTNAFGGTALEAVDSPTECRRQCCLIPNCLAYEWDTQSQIKILLGSDLSQEELRRRMGSKRLWLAYTP